jgi:hypothetical protein
MPLEVLDILAVLEYGVSHEAEPSDSILILRSPSAMATLLTTSSTSIMRMMLKVYLHETNKEKTQVVYSLFHSFRLPQTVRQSVTQARR